MLIEKYVMIEVYDIAYETRRLEPIGDIVNEHGPYIRRVNPYLGAVHVTGAVYDGIARIDFEKLVAMFRKVKWVAEIAAEHELATGFANRRKDVRQMFSISLWIYILIHI